MARWLSVGPGGPELCPAASIGELIEAGSCFHVDSSHPSFTWIKELGVEVRLLEQGEVPPDGLIVVPISTASQRSRAEALDRLVSTVDRLLGPGGCPWDQEQTHETLKRHLLEEVYEVFDAIDSGDDTALVEELGDLLLQPFMHSQIAAVGGRFDAKDIADAVTDKLVRRHPHVFGNVSVNDAEEVLKNWDRIKLEEKSGDAPKSILMGVPQAMPSLLRAFEISKRAARVGFEWPQYDSVVQKLQEEVAELEEAVQSKSHEDIESEIGDVLFTVVNLARWQKVEPELALRQMLNRFTARFMQMEAIANKPLQELNFDEWDNLWNRAKILTQAKEST